MADEEEIEVEGLEDEETEMVECEECGRRVLSEDATDECRNSESRIIRGFVCMDCAGHCDECGEVYAYTALTHYGSDRSLCPECESHCDVCEEWYDPRDQHEHVHPDSLESYREYYENQAVVNSYSANPTNYIHSDLPGDGKKLWMGIELEFNSITASDGPSHHSRVLKEFHKELKSNQCYAIIKSDSTVSGGEICTIPATLDQHREKMGRVAQFFNDNDHLFTTDEDDDGNRAGLHVHLDRAYLSLLDISKILVFVNNPRFRKQIVGVAGRDYQMYAKLSEKSFTDVRKRCAGHYDAVNLEAISKHGTIEIRIFQATSNYEELMMRLEFCHALVHFVKDASLLDFELDGWERFQYYVASWKKLYPHLQNYMEEVDARINPKQDHKDDVAKDGLDFSQSAVSGGISVAYMGGM